MTDVRGPAKTGPISDAAAKKAAEEAGRRAAEAAARAAAAAEAAVMAATRAAEAARVTKGLADGGAVSNAAGLEANAGPVGAKALPALPFAPPGFEAFKNFGGAIGEAVVGAVGAAVSAVNDARVNTGPPVVAAPTPVPRTLDEVKAFTARLAKADPGQISAQDRAALAELGKSADPTTKRMVADLARGWVNDAIKDNLAGKKGKSGVEAAMKGFREDVRELAKATGLSAEVLQTAVKDGITQNKGAIEDVAEKGKKWWQKALDAVGDVIGDVADFAGDIVKDVADVAGDAVNAVTDVAADAIRLGGEVTGAVANAVIDTTGQVVGAGLDAVGADGAASGVRAASDALGDVAKAGFEMQGKIVGGAVDIAGDVVDGALDIAGTVVDTGLDVAGAVIADGPMGAAERLADGVIGPEIPEFAGQVDGFTGVVTNRLDKGDSVFVRGEAGAEVGVGLFAGAKLTGGAVLGRDPKGMITLSLEVGGELEGGVKAEFGAKAGTSLASVGAKAEASASLTAGAKGKVNLKFDPDKPEDVARLKALLEPTPLKLAAAAVNPLAVAALSGPALKDALENNLASTEVSGTAGGKAGAKASASVGPLAAELGVGADAVLGASHKLNKDGSTETTLYVKVGAKASASATVQGTGLGVEAGAGVDGVVAVKVKKDKDGNITGIAGEQDGRFSTNAGLIHKDKSKTDLKDGEKGLKGTKTSAGAGHSVTSTVEQELNATGLAEAKARLARGENVISVFLDLNDEPGKFTEIRTTTETDSASFGFGAEFAVGAKLGLNAKVTVGKAHTTSERDEAPGLHTDLATQAAPFGGAAGDHN